MNAENPSLRRRVFLLIWKRMGEGPGVPAVETFWQNVCTIIWILNPHPFLYFFVNFFLWLDCYRDYDDLYRSLLIMLDIYFMNRYRIASNRMSWCDYDIWWFFVTICTNDKIHYFGKIVDGVMVLNDMGKIVYDEIIHIPNHRKNIRIDEFVVIPNHIHMIIIIDDCPRRDVLTKRLYDYFGFSHPGGIDFLR